MEDQKSSRDHLGENRAQNSVAASLSPAGLDVRDCLHRGNNDRIGGDCQ